MTKIDEPLDLSAPLAWRLAARLCHKDAATGRDCAWNHGLWQYLRLLGLDGSPAVNAESYWRAFAMVTSSAGPPRILISGAADYSILAHVLAAFKERGIAPNVTVVDICETPLALNRWYAERISCKIATQRCDIFEFETANTFDAICTHAFFGQIAPGRRPQLLAAWRRLLRPGGIAISVDRIRPASNGTAIGFTPSQAQAFCATVLREAERRQESLGIDLRDLGRAAELYASTQSLYPVRSREEILELFGQTGFGVDQLICGPNESAIQREDSGPTIPAKADYASVIATRL